MIDAKNNKKPLHGICVGLQMFADVGYEETETKGLGWVSGKVAKIDNQNGKYKLPHIGWNQINILKNSKIFKKNTLTEATKYNKPKLTLVGAGPGDPDLITVKGMKAIASADVILYDALVDKDLLNYAKTDAIKIFVGKRGGKRSIKQEQINLLIVKYAYQYGSVVRLKGGDPFVFGRGHEELEYAENFGILTEIIPGITSAISVPALQGIPVTRRGISAVSYTHLTLPTKA